MEIWYTISIAICCLVFLKSLFNLVIRPNPKQGKKMLPPGPTDLPVIGMFRFLGKNVFDLQVLFISWMAKYGPIITFRAGGLRPIIMLGTGSLVHQALVLKGALFADRPELPPMSKIMSSDAHSISTSRYGPTWRSLRRNFTTFLHPSHFKSYTQIRERVLCTLIERLKVDSESHEGVVKVLDHFQFAIFSVLALICFGNELDDNQLDELERSSRQFLTLRMRFDVLDQLPMWLTKIIFHARWKKFFEVKKGVDEVVLQHLTARKLKQNESHGSRSSPPTYVDSLLQLELEEDNGGKRELTDDQLISASSEFIGAGSETTLGVLQWIMANLVKYPKIQDKLLKEINKVVGEEAKEVTEEDLPKIPYLRAVVLEGLRRHPAIPFMLAHVATKEVELGDYTVPKNAMVNFMAANIAWNPETWEEPMKFKPERFLAEEPFDICGSREVKMMPFGVGRRMCPGYILALLHLDYFVANLVKTFEWKPVEGDDVDLTPFHEFTVVMKYPLKAQISPRRVKA
ncbi:Cytochrome P450 89A2-like protein [Drosera capensis]